MKCAQASVWRKAVGHLHGSAGAGVDRAQLAGRGRYRAGAVHSGMGVGGTAGCGTDGCRSGADTAGKEVKKNAGKNGVCQIA